MKKPECFGKENGYLMKCNESHHAPEKNCPLIEKCYQVYLDRKYGNSLTKNKGERRG